MPGLIEVKSGNQLIGYVQEGVIDGTTRWRSWRPEDLHRENSVHQSPAPIGVHQDQEQAEGYLRQLKDHADRVTGVTSRSRLTRNAF
ncbi:hypothetical protein ACQP2E_16365 [Actinoplanes sp. CA-015351]|uniref:hypothetical protein n=1 Tax=Actinoplanes sp. CA-015351 TaxID=3239897 RepID=UPI003D955FA7